MFEGVSHQDQRGLVHSLDIRGYPGFYSGAANLGDPPPTWRQGKTALDMNGRGCTWIPTVFILPKTGVLRSDQAALGEVNTLSRRVW